MEAQSNISAQSKKALWVSLILGIMFTAITIFVAYQVVISEIYNWQGISGIIIFAIMSISAWVSAYFSYRQRPQTGIPILIISLIILILYVPLIVASRGTVLALIGLLIIIGISIQTLPDKRANLWIATGSIASILAVLLDLWLPIERTITTYTPWPLYGMSLAAIGFFVFLLFQFNRLGLRSKLLVVFAGVPAIVVILVGGFFLFTFNNKLNTQIEQNRIADVVVQQERLNFFLDDVSDDVQILSESVSLQNYLSALENGADPETVAAAQEAINTEFYSFARARSIYDQVRFLDTTGQEMVRVNTNRDGISTIVPEGNLQNKAGRYYFDDTFALNEGELMISPLDLNVENGVVEEPHKPVIRYGTPVFHNGEKAGVIVTNVLADNFLSLLESENNINFLIDDEGYFLYHPEEDLRWGRDLGTGITIQEESPDLASALFLGETANFNDNINLYAYTPVRLSEEDAPRWFLTSALPVDIAFAVVNETLATSQAVLAIALMLTPLLALAVSVTLTRPMSALTDAAKEISQGNLDVVVELKNNDEFGVLAQMFNQMSQRLRESFNLVETEVQERTQDLLLAADVSKNISQEQDLNQLAAKAANLIQQRFSLYYVQIYLADPQQKNLSLLVGTGEPGKRMMDIGHNLPIDTYSTNGQAAATKQPVIVPDTLKSNTFRPNPLLPDTRSEMTIPLLLDEDVLGVIDLQSSEPNNLTEDVLPAFTVLAGQLAVAITNARRNRAMQENQRLLRTIINTTPDWIFVKDKAHRYQLVNRAYADAFDMSPALFIGKDDLELGFPEIIVKGDPEKGIPGFKQIDQEIMNSGKARELPEEVIAVNNNLKVFQTIKAPLVDTNGEVTGLVGFAHDITDRKLAEETIARRADELQSVAELSTAVSTIADPQQLLQAVVDLTKQRFGLYHAHIYLVDDSGENLMLAAGAGTAGKEMVAEKLSIPLNQEQSLVARAARDKEGVIVNDVVADTGFLPNPLLPDTRAEMAIPIIVGSDVLGVLDVQADSIDYFSDEDVQIQTTLASQTAVALQNARQYNTLQQSQGAIRERETLLRTIIDSTPDWIFVKDSNHRYLMVNQGYADSLHMSADDFIGKNDLDIGFPEDIVKGNPEKGIRGFWADDREIMERGELVIIDMEPAIIDGEERFLNTIKAPLQDNAGNVVGIVGFVHDITNRIISEELTRERESLLRTIVDASPDWIFVKNKEHRYQLVNKAYADSFHLTPEQFIGQNDLEVGFPEDIVRGNLEKGIRGFWPDDDEIMASKQMKVIPEEPAEVDGQAVVLRTIKAPLLDGEGNVAGIVGFVQDITAQKETQKDQERLAQKFEEQLAQVNALQRVMTRDNWSNYINNQQNDDTGFSFTGESVEAFDSHSLKAIMGERPLDFDTVSQVSLDKSQKAVILPLQLHGESIGIIGARTANGEPINAEQNALLTTLTAQVAESLDRARLFEETETARSQTEALFTGSQQVVRATNVTEILHAVINATQLQSYERANMVFFDRLLTPTDTPEFATITAVWSHDGQPNAVPVGTKFATEQYPLFSFLDREKPMFIDDLSTDEHIDENIKELLLNQLNMRSLLTVPLVIGDNWLGSIVCVANETKQLNDDDIRQITSLAGQAATVAQSQRLYDEAQSRAEREQILRQVSDRVYAAPDAETVLRTAAREIGQALGLETFIYLEDELTEEETLPTTT